MPNSGANMYPFEGRETEILFPADVADRAGVPVSMIRSGYHNAVSAQNRLAGCEGQNDV